jgi:hypothetical protein
MYVIHGRNLEADNDDAMAEALKSRGVERAWPLHSEIDHHYLMHHTRLRMLSKCTHSKFAEAICKDMPVEEK